MTCSITYKVLTTPAPRRSFPLPTSPNSYFTGDLFDRLVLFLHKHHIAFTSIECVARGVDKTAALRDGPTLCVYVVQDASVTRRSVWRSKEEDGKNEEYGKQEFVVVKERKESQGEGGEGVRGEGEVNTYQQVWSGEVDFEGTQRVHLLKKPQAEAPTSHYVEGVSRLFRECQFAHEVPPEICFVEFVGIILHEDPGRNARAAETWSNGGVMGFLTGS